MIISVNVCIIPKDSVLLYAASLALVDDEAEHLPEFQGEQMMYSLKG